MKINEWLLSKFQTQCTATETVLINFWLVCFYAIEFWSYLLMTNITAQLVALCDKRVKYATKCFWLIISTSVYSWELKNTNDFAPKYNISSPGKTLKPSSLSPILLEQNLCFEHGQLDINNQLGKPTRIIKYYPHFLCTTRQREKKWHLSHVFWRPRLWFINCKNRFTNPLLPCPSVICPNLCWWFFWAS
jgi:hypothetical protein